VHVAWPYFEKLEPWQAAFSGIRPARALWQLREMLGRLGYDDAAIYRTHDLRRGHALDIQERGGSLQEIWAAGEWKPGSHLAYMNIPKLRNSVVEAAHHLETILADSSSEEED